MVEKRNRLMKKRNPKEKKTCFTMVPNNLLQFRPDTVSDSAWLLYLHLRSLSEDYSPSIEGIAKKRNVSKSKIQRAVEELEKAGLLEIENTGQREYLWTVHEEE